MQHRSIRGRIRYTSRKPDRLGQVRGDERFHFTRHTDGKITLRAHCEIEEPAPTVLRDVRTGLVWSIAIAGGTPSMRSTAGRSMRSRNCRA